jgi:hypothetical protein
MASPPFKSRGQLHNGCLVGSKRRELDRIVDPDRPTPTPRSCVRQGDRAGNEAEPHPAAASVAFIAADGWLNVDVQVVPCLVGLGLHSL